MRFAVRAALVLVLVGAVFGLCVHYGDTEDDQWPYPTDEELATDYDSHVGEVALVWGTPEAFGNVTDTALIVVESAEGSFEMTVQDFDTSVRPGGTVQVYGVLEPDRTVNASNVEVVNSSEGAELYKYAVSAVGAALVLALFFRHWRFDAESLAFEVRDDG